MGKHPFRVAPGRTLDGSPPEAWGVQAVLESGHAPPVRPNGLAEYIETVPAAYLDGNSDAWVCPSNPGPIDTGDGQPYWPDYGNTYAYRYNSMGTYNLDVLAESPSARRNPLVWDNFTKLFGFPGVSGPFSGPAFTVPRDQQQAPHYLGSRGFWMGFSVTGHIIKVTLPIW
ncbi:MAG: hypothetical protein GY778_28040 [bacterium]|nr:hypothetical protein [bacterium]